MKSSQKSGMQPLHSQVLVSNINFSSLKLESFSYAEKFLNGVPWISSGQTSGTKEQTIKHDCINKWNDLDS